MNDRNLLAFVLVAILVVVVIIAVIQLSSVLNSPAPDPNGSSESLDAIRVEPNDIDVSNDGLTELDLQITIRIESGSNPQRRFNDVYLCLYDSAGDPIIARNLGDFEAKYQIIHENVNTSTPPAYTFVHHPDFRTLNGEYSILQYDNETDPPWSTPGVNALPFDHDDMNWTGCQSP